MLNQRFGLKCLMEAIWEDVCLGAAFLPFSLRHVGHQWEVRC